MLLGQKRQFLCEYVPNVIKVNVSRENNLKTAFLREIVFLNCNYLKTHISGSITAAISKNRIVIAQSSEDI